MLDTAISGPGRTPPVRLCETRRPTAQGINGASYSAAASLYKLIGYTPKGYDGVDNDRTHQPGMASSTTTRRDLRPERESGTQHQAAGLKVETFLTNHRHKTARAEMLYALLVEGIGPLGSVFNREDFRDTEVKDTDNDGVPEFVDGWGEPLQFFRWPFYARLALQKGASLYNRLRPSPASKNPFDPNNQLTSIAWWTTDDPTNPGQPSLKNLTVQNLLLPLADPNWVSGTTQPALDVGPIGGDG